VTTWRVGGGAAAAGRTGIGGGDDAVAGRVGDGSGGGEVSGGRGVGGGLSRGGLAVGGGRRGLTVCGARRPSGGVDTYEENTLSPRVPVLSPSLERSFRRGRNRDVICTNLTAVILFVF